MNKACCIRLQQALLQSDSDTADPGAVIEAGADSYITFPRGEGLAFGPLIRPSGTFSLGRRLSPAGGTKEPYLSQRKPFQFSRIACTIPSAVAS
jgi:hypothetical protein